MSTPTIARRAVPKAIRDLPLGKRMRWARTSAGLSHDKLVEKMGRSNRGHVIKVEKGDHTPRIDLRNDWADATNVPRELFATDEDEEDRQPMSFDDFLRYRASIAVREALALQSNDPAAHSAASTTGSSTKGA